jgi:hypothetical protein
LDQKKYISFFVFTGSFFFLQKKPFSHHFVLMEWGVDSAEFADMDEQERADMEGFLPGRYVRITISVSN